MVQLFAKALCNCAVGAIFLSRKNVWNEFCSDTPYAQNFAVTHRMHRIFSQNCKTRFRIFRQRPSEGIKALMALIFFFRQSVMSTGGRKDVRVLTIHDQLF
jgi:hypothetical protein